MHQELQGCPLRIALPPPLANPKEALGDTLTVDGTQEISTRRSEKNPQDEAPSTTTAEVPSVSTFSNPFYIAIPLPPSLPTPQSPSSLTSSLATSSLSSVPPTRPSSPFHTPPPLIFCSVCHNSFGTEASLGAHLRKMLLSEGQFHAP
jgi:hypothetical protein